MGTKQHMTELFDADGRVWPATIVSAGPVTVTDIRTSERDGYSAVQVGYGTQKESRISKPQLGHLKGAGPFRVLREFAGDKKIVIEDVKVGDVIAADTFKEGDSVVVSATSKGKGFQGVVKRHGFHGGSRSHGQKHSEREPGSIGGGGRSGGRVVKGMRMAGRMGGDRITVKNLKVLRVDAENNLLYLSGAIPGRRGTVVEVKGK